LTEHFKSITRPRRRYRNIVPRIHLYWAVHPMVQLYQWVRDLATTAGWTLAVDMSIFYDDDDMGEHTI
jgi:hypothetical protein